LNAGFKELRASPPTPDLALEIPDDEVHIVNPAED
jgi:hypothetical protein